MANTNFDANNFTLSTNFNTSPYYDDFDAYKDFYRILYKPGMAVQARELTQMQTILQKQIDRFGEHIFKEGSIVSGCSFNINLARPFIKIRDNNYLGASVSPSNFVGSIITGLSTGVKAYVEAYDDGAEASSPNTKTLYLRYTASGSNGTTNTFGVAERFTSNTSFTANVISSNTGIGYGSAFSIGPGVIFAKDHFIRTSEQTVTLDKYSNTPSYRVGFEIEEEIVSSNDDTSLTDPASGSYNYAAPGADRLKITAVLTAKELTANTVNFVQLFMIEDGILKVKNETTQYSLIRDELARRTFDESGNYTVRGLDVIVREHLNSNTNNGLYYSEDGGDALKLAVGIEPGKAYVLGYDYENLYTRYLPIDKGIDYLDIEQQTITANYGSYVQVNEVCGNWDVSNHPVVKLYSTAQDKVSGGSYSTGSPTGSQIGTARVRALDYVSGGYSTPNSYYNLYLYDVKMSNGSFSAVRGIVADSLTTKGYADPVLVSNNAILSETGFDSALYILPATAVRRLRDSSGNIDNTYEFYKNFDVTISSGGTFTLATGSADETFPYSIGALNDTQIAEDIYVVTNATQTTTNLTGTVSTSTGSNTVNGVGTSFTTQLQAEDNIKVGANVYRIHSISSANTLVLTTVGAATVSGQNFQRQYYQGKVLDFTRAGATGTDRTVTVGSSTSATFDLKETLTGTVSATAIVKLRKVDGQEKRKILRSSRLVKINIATHASGTTGPWDLGFSDVFKLISVRKKSSNFASTSDGTDVTSYFTLDTGQRDSIYNHAYISNTGGLSIGGTDYLLVEFSYFEHDTSQGVGYFSVDSYPIDDISVANTSAVTTKEIPIFTSPYTGIRYNLRDSIDIRPSLTATANSVTSLTNITTNPTTTTTLQSVSGGLHYMPPNSQMIADLSYYLSRKDLVTLSSTGAYNVVRGVPATTPITPTPPDDTMSLARIEIPPFPSLSTAVAYAFNRKDLAANITKIENKRYRMRDIGVLEQRISNLEYYVSLSLLEKDAKDLVILDGNGLDRFKNGILVDAFTSHAVGNVYDVDYKISIDPRMGEARPTFNLNNIDLFYVSGSSTNVVRKSSDATITVASTTSFSLGETVFQGATFGTATATGILRSKSSTKLYLEQVTGTFATSTATKGNTSGASSISSVVTTMTDGNLVTLPYTHEEFVKQQYASTIRNPSGLFYSWKGSMELIPDADHWVDTTTIPDLQVNIPGEMDNWTESSAPWSTQWGAWETIVRGTTTTTTGNTTRTTTTSDQERDGTRTRIVPETVSQSLGDRVVDVSVRPWIRSREVKFSAIGLKPSTQVWPFFDSEDVSAHVIPANSSYVATGVKGDDLVTDADGNLYGIFIIPNDETLRFRIGQRMFRVCDSLSNETELGLVNTSAEAEYVASGLVQTVQETIISTKVPKTVTENITETRTVVDTQTRTTRPPNDRRRDGQDPIAQTFVVFEDFDNINVPGMFATKLEIFFQQKDTVQPVMIELRTVQGGKVTEKAIPYSRSIVYPTDVNISNDGSEPTVFYFPSPVFLSAGSEYAIVVKAGGNSPNYKVWTAKLGQSDITSGNRINKQPSIGVLYASSNDRNWSPIQDEDLKFTLYRAKFNKAVTGVAVLGNEPKEYLTVTGSTGLFDIETVKGETRLTVTGLANGTPILGQKVWGQTSNTYGTITDISGSVYRLKSVTLNQDFTSNEGLRFKYANNTNTGAYANVSSYTVPSGKVKLYDPRTSANTIVHVANSTGGFIAGEYIEGQRSGSVALIHSLDDLRLNVYRPDVQNLEFANTNIDWYAKNTSVAHALDADYTLINMSENNETIAEKRVVSRSEEINDMSSSKSHYVKGIMTTQDDYISPAIDLSIASTIIVGNIINNDSTGEDSEMGGNAQARYITKIVTLDEGQDAEDLRVYASVYKPPNTDIKAYYKILNGEDSDTFNDNVSWVEMTEPTPVVSDGVYKYDFKETHWEIPESMLTGPNDEVRYVNSQGITFTGFKRFIIKMVLLSSDTSIIPRLKDFRVIALQK